MTQLTTLLEAIQKTKPSWVDDCNDRLWPDLVEAAKEAREIHIHLAKETDPVTAVAYHESVLSTRGAYNVAKITCEEISGKLRTLTEQLLNASSSIQTHCRIRPRQANSSLQNEIYVIDQNYLKLVKLGKDIINRETREIIGFRFDGITKHNSRQEDFKSYILPLYQPILQGKTVCIFYYGPTDSGKSYTMFGPSNPKGGPGGLIYAIACELMAKIRAFGQEPNL